ncbi:type II secretion system F family protein [Shewanella sp. MMG014]|uniref:type II secretion system F family protein n=1 Tax=Shewanella sp. MMG014 TaxID=2822691 RepID=UPI001B3917EC|nr:type II secretion system F family protein [Shewanella sp. MMG014]
MKLNTKKRLEVYKQFYALTKEGVGVKDSLETLLAIANKTKSIWKVRLFESWLKKYSELPNLSMVIKDDIVENEFLLISTSEKSGEIYEGFLEVIQLIESNRKIKDLLVGSLVPPLFLFFVCIVIIVGYAHQVLEVFIPFAPVSKWPVISAALYNTGHYFTSIAALIHIIIVISIFVGVFYFLKHGKGKFRDLLHRTGLFKIQEMFVVVNFLKMLGTLMLSGVSFSDAINEIYKLTNQGWLRSRLAMIKDEIKKTNAVVDCFDVYFLPPELLSLIGVYSSTGDFSHSINIVANNLREELEGKLKKLGKIFNLFGVLLVSATAIWIYYAMFNLSGMLTKNG